MAIGESENLRAAEPVYQDAQHVISVCENTVLTCSNDAPNPRYLEAWTRTVELVAKRFPAELLAITIINHRAHAPDEASRTHIRSTVLRHAAELKAFAYVVDGEGFRAAGIRSALSLISLAARYPFPMKVFGRVEEAVPWVLNRPRRGVPGLSDGAKLVHLANSLRGQLGYGAAIG